MADGAGGAAFIARLSDALRQLGCSEVFVDTADISVGDFFADRIHGAISNCDLFIPLIGRDWQRLLDEKQNGLEPDILERELETALALEKDVIPILIDGADMPRAAELPDSIRDLASIDGEPVGSDASSDALRLLLESPVRAAAQVHKPGPWWARGYVILGILVWLFCGLAPNYVGLQEFGTSEWVGMAKAWAGFFIWPFFVMPFIVLALYRPFQVLLEAALNAQRSSDALKFISPVIGGLGFALVMTIVEISPPQVPWTIHPKLSPACSGPPDLGPRSSPDRAAEYERLRETLRSYGAAGDTAIRFRDEFWIRGKCWPGVFFYLTAPLRYGSAPPLGGFFASESAAIERTKIQPAFLKMLGRDSRGFKGTDAPYSYVFWTYIPSFFLMSTLFSSALLTIIILTSVSIRRPRDGRVLRAPREDASFCLMFGCIAALTWVPFRVITNSIKFYYYCVDPSVHCGPTEEVFLKDVMFGLAWVTGYVVLSVGLLLRHKRLLLGLIATVVTSLLAASVVAVYFYHEIILRLTDYWQFWLAISLLITIALIVLWYLYDPAIVRFRDFQDKSRRRPRRRGRSEKG